MENRMHRSGEKRVTAHVDFPSEGEVERVLQEKGNVFDRFFSTGISRDSVIGPKRFFINLAIWVLWKLSDDATMSFTSIGEKYDTKDPGVAGASVQVFVFDFLERKDRKTVTAWLNSD